MLRAGQGREADLREVRRPTSESLGFTDGLGGGGKEESKQVSALQVWVDNCD